MAFRLPWNDGDDPGDSSEIDERQIAAADRGLTALVVEIQG
jgi:hypothetical protein